MYNVRNLGALPDVCRGLVLEPDFQIGVRGKGFGKGFWCHGNNTSSQNRSGQWNYGVGISGIAKTLFHPKKKSELTSVRFIGN